MRHPLAHALLASAALAITGCAGEAEQWSPPSYPSSSKADRGLVDPAYFGGTWEGRGCQSDGPCWTIRIRIEADEEGRPVGMIRYPSVPCTARLQFVEWEAGDVAVFRERFRNASKCVPDGWLRLRLLGEDRMSFVWSFPDGRVDAGTTLERAR